MTTGAGNQNSVPWGAWLLLALTVAATGGGLALMATACTDLLATASPVDRAAPFILVVSSILFAILGLMILYRHPGHTVGWLCAATGALGAASVYVLVHGECAPTALPAPALFFWLSYLLGPLQIVPQFILLPMLFPDGHFLSPRWRAFTMVGCSAILVLLVFVALLSGPMNMNGMGPREAPDNPFALAILPASAGPALNTAMATILISLALVAILSLVLRYRRSRGEVRQQLKWIAYFFVVAFGTQIIFFEIIGAFVYPDIFDSLPYAVIITIVFLGYPTVIGIAILRYRLYDIDVIIRRTLVYALVTGALALVYVGSIIVLQSLFVTVTGQQSTVAIVVSTLLIAALFNPLRRRVQALIDRRFYRRKYDAELTLVRFGAVARDEVDLETLTTELLGAVDRTVQPSGTTLWLRDRQP